VFSEEAVNNKAIVFGLTCLGKTKIIIMSSKINLFLLAIAVNCTLTLRYKFLSDEDLNVIMRGMTWIF
jgi:hypothetical protein